MENSFDNENGDPNGNKPATEKTAASDHTAKILRISLQSNPKYIPSWYIYNKDGSELFEKILRDNTFYYFKSAEMEVLRNSMEEVIKMARPPCALVELGSGSSKKTKVLIDTILQQQPVLKYVPIDISEDFLKEACNGLIQDYKGKLDIQMLASEYDTAIPEIRKVPSNKIILWLGGFQNQSFENQVKRLQMIADSMQETDVALLTVDLTQDAKQINDAYLDPFGICDQFYRNAFTRLAHEFRSNIKEGDIEIKSKYEDHIDAGILPGCVLIRAQATKTQMHNIPGLGINLQLEKGEYINLYEGEGYSFKYTREQLESIGKLGGLTLANMWTDTRNHVALCCFRRRV